MSRNRRATTAPGAGKGKAAGGGAQSVRELARRVDRSHTAVTKWLADPRWPFARRGPWDARTVGEIRQWATTTLEPDKSAHAGDSAAAAAGLAEATSQSKAKLALTVEKVKNLRQAREIKGGLYHLVADCKARRLRQVTAVRTELLNLPERAPFADEVKEWLRREVTDICERFARGE